MENNIGTYTEIPLCRVAGGDAEEKAFLSGSLVVEECGRRGVLFCRVQGLTTTEGGSIEYKLVFLGMKEKRMISALVGNVFVGKNGTGEARFRFDPANFDGKGNAWDSFSTAAIAATREPGKLLPILTGCIPEKKREGRARMVYESLMEKRETAETGTETEKASDASSNERKTQEIGFKTCEKSDGQKEGYLPCGEKRQSEGEAASAEKYNDFYFQYLLRFCRRICHVAGYYRETAPFLEDSTHAEWKRVANVGTLPVVSPGAHYFAAQYGHYLFGVEKSETGEVLRYYFAIPGKKDPAEQPDGGESGFVLWQPIRREGKDCDSTGGVERQCTNLEGYGYWIAGLNAGTGMFEGILAARE